MIQKQQKQKNDFIADDDNYKVLTVITRIIITATIRNIMIIKIKIMVSNVDSTDYGMITTGKVWVIIKISTTKANEKFLNN